MKFEQNVVKYDDFNCAYNEDCNSTNILPTIRIYDKDLGGYVLGITMYKWSENDGPRKGKYIAVYCLTEFCRLWSDIDLQHVYDDLQTNRTFIDDFECDYNKFHLCSSIIVFKFSVNVWRHVELQGKMSKKWVFVDTKPDKLDESKLQRLLKN